MHRNSECTIRFLKANAFGHSSSLLSSKSKNQKHLLCLGSSGNPHKSNILHCKHCTRPLLLSDYCLKYQPCVWKWLLTANNQLMLTSGYLQSIITWCFQVVEAIITTWCFQVVQAIATTRCLQPMTTRCLQPITTRCLTSEYSLCIITRWLKH